MTGQAYSRREAICYQWFKQRLILSISKPSISQQSQIKKDTVKHSVPAREFNLKVYATITWHNDPASLGLKPRLSDHCSQVARTTKLSITPPGQVLKCCMIYNCCELSYRLSAFFLFFGWLILVWFLKLLKVVQFLACIGKFYKTNETWTAAVSDAVIYTVSRKKGATDFFAVTFTNIDGFS